MCDRPGSGVRRNDDKTWALQRHLHAPDPRVPPAQIRMAQLLGATPHTQIAVLPWADNGTEIRV